MRACLREELIAVPDALPLPPLEVLQRLYDEDRDVAEYLRAHAEPVDGLHDA